MSEFPTFAQLSNAPFIDALYASYQSDPSSVDPSWRLFFAGMEVGKIQESDYALRSFDLVQAYRRYGHLLANSNPLVPAPRGVAELALENFGFKESDLEQLVPTHGVLAGPSAPLRELIDAAKATYCSSIGAGRFSRIRATYALGRYGC